MQSTFSDELCLEGTGLHTGIRTAARMRPAPENHGIEFRRIDGSFVDPVIPATVEYVTDTFLCTTIGNKSGAEIKTIEHLMASLAGCGVNNAIIEVDGPEIPMLDGSAMDFAQAMLKAGIESQSDEIKVLRVLDRVAVEIDGAFASLEPGSFAEMAFTIVFPEPVGTQHKSMSLANGAVVKHLVDSRTFCTKSAIPMISEAGYGLGGTVEGVVVADDENNCFWSSVRYSDEMVRHKMLDAVGDLALAGFPIIGKFTGVRSGHGTTVALLKKLLATPDAYVIEYADSEVASELPGAGVAMSDLWRPQ